MMNMLQKFEVELESMQIQSDKMCLMLDQYIAVNAGFQNGDANGYVDSQKIEKSLYIKKYKEQIINVITKMIMSNQRCRFCDQIFMSKVKCASHIFSKHSNQCKFFICEECNTSFCKVYQFKNHLMTHNRKFKFIMNDKIGKQVENGVAILIEKQKMIDKFLHQQ